MHYTYMIYFVLMMSNAESFIHQHDVVSHLRVPNAKLEQAVVKTEAVKRTAAYYEKDPLKTVEDMKISRASAIKKIKSMVRARVHENVMAQSQVIENMVQEHHSAKKQLASTPQKPQLSQIREEMQTEEMQSEETKVDEFPRLSYVQFTESVIVTDQQIFEPEEFDKVTKLEQMHLAANKSIITENLKNSELAKIEKRQV